MNGLAQRLLHVRAPIYVWVVVALTLAISGTVVNALFPTLTQRPDQEGGLTIVLPPDRLFTLLNVPVTNTLLSASLATLLLVGLFLGARLLAQVGHPGMLSATQALLHAYLRFVQNLVGGRMVAPLFVLSCSVLLFILANAWIALLPVYGSVFVGTSEGETVSLLRGAGTDINMPLAMSLMVGILTQGFGLLTLRLAYVERFFRFRRLLRGQILTGTMDSLAGFFDLFVELTRILSFTFRLFGSLTASEVLILVIGFIAPLIVVVPFYGLELLLGAIQAYIFGSLFAVFAATAMHPHQERERR